MAKVIWSDTAVDNLDQIVAYIAVHDRRAAGEIGARLFRLGESLCDFPDRGRPADGGRRELVSVPPYILRYRVEDDRVHVLNIRHGRQQIRD